MEQRRGWLRARFLCRYANAHPDADENPNTDQHHTLHQHADAVADQNPDTSAGGNQHANEDTDSRPDRNCDCHQHADEDADTHGHADEHGAALCRHADANRLVAEAMTVAPAGWRLVTRATP